MNMNKRLNETVSPSAWLVNALGISVGLVTGFAIVVMVIGVRI